jgi:SHS family lactate transporter-like MFS transporter
MGCVFAYVILVTFVGPERLGRNFDAEHDADLQVVVAHRGIDGKGFPDEEKGRTETVE